MQFHAISISCLYDLSSIVRTANIDTEHVSCGCLQKVKNNGKFRKNYAQKLVWLNLQRGQHAKKVVSDSPGLVDFAIGLVNSVINLPDGQVKSF